jgi:hypothetical protein
MNNMMRLGLAVGLVVLLVGCGDDQPSPMASPIVQGEIKYFNLQGLQTGSLRGADIARVELKATGNQTDYDVRFFDRQDQQVVWAFPNYFDFSANQFSFYIDEKSQHGCMNNALKGCDDLTLSVQPTLGALRLQAKQSPLIELPSSTNNTQNGTMSGELRATIQPNALVFQTNRFPVIQRSASMTLTKASSEKIYNLEAANYRRDVVWQQGRLVREIELLNTNDQPDSNDVISLDLQLDPDTHQLLAADGVCLANCQPQVIQTGNVLDLTWNQATFGALNSGQVYHTMSGRLMLSITTGQLNAASTTIFAPQNFDAWVTNNTANYRFTQVFASQQTQYKELKIAVEDGNIQQMTLEDVVSGETSQVQLLASCGGKMGKPCQGIRLAADGRTFSFDQVKMLDGTTVSGSIIHGGV